MTSTAFTSIFRSRAFLVFMTVMTLLALAGGYQLSRIFSQVDDASTKRSVQLFEIEESLDDAAIGLGHQVQEWKDMLLRMNNKELYDKHQKAFKESSIGVQFALLKAKTTMQDIGMNTAEIERLTIEHKTLLSEYLQAYSKLEPKVTQSSGSVDMRIIGVDRKLQQDISSVKAGISIFAKQQLYRTPQTQGSRHLMVGLLGTTSLLFMALFGFVFARLFTKP